jgi:sialate O-acetylesterase
MLFASLFVGTASADVRLPALVGDSMVLQRETQVRIWGWADPGEEVRVRASWADGEARTQANAAGDWSVELATGPAGGPHTLQISGKNRITLKDVLLGEVWICGGQSNMQWTLDDCAPLYDEVKQAAQHPEIRLFTAAQYFAPRPVMDNLGRWQACDPSSVGSFSAVAFFFGRELHLNLAVPIGLVSCNWGGTLAEAWTSAETLQSWPEFAPGLAFMDECATDPAAVEARHKTLLAQWWQALEADEGGSRQNWQAQDFDDSTWAEMAVPNDWHETPLADFDGITWMRHDFEAPEDWAGRECIIDLGPIDDMDTTWVNGVRVGGHEDAGLWTQDRSYVVPAGVVRAGPNSIAVRIYDSGGYGGLYGQAQQLSIAPLDVSRVLALAGNWRYRASTPMSELEPWPASASLSQDHPSALYNGMLAPITNFAMRGVIWYQGESNRLLPEQYERLFPALISDWRASWGRGDFPFYFVQIAPFEYDDDTGEAASLRDAQRKTLRVAGTGMVVTLDIGNPTDIHPKNKLVVGQRLALWARAKTYGEEELTCSGPLYRSIQRDGAALRIFFDAVGGGLSARNGGPLTHFEVAGSDGVYQPAVALIEGESLLLRSAAVPKPSSVRFAWGAADEPNLTNTEGLPASSFQATAP